MPGPDEREQAVPRERPAPPAASRVHDELESLSPLPGAASPLCEAPGAGAAEAGAGGRFTPERSAPADPVGDALSLGYRALARHDRTVSEVRSYLLNHGCDETAAEEALGELREQGYLDDERYARRFAEDRRTLDGWGAERIARRLDDAGVPVAVIEATLAERDHEDELEAALDVLRGKLRVAPSDERGRERALGLLVRRGYELELAYDAVRAFEREAA